MGMPCPIATEEELENYMISFLLSCFIVLIRMSSGIVEQSAWSVYSAIKGCMDP